MIIRVVGYGVFELPQWKGGGVAGFAKEEAELDGGFELVSAKGVEVGVFALNCSWCTC